MRTWTLRAGRRRLAAACLIALFLLGLAPSASADETAPPHIDEFGETGAGDGQFDEILALAFDAEGNWYAGDYGHHRIEKFTEDGDFVTAWGGPGTGDGQFNHINGLVVYHDAVADADRLLVSDSTNSRLQCFTLGGTFVAKVTSVAGATPTGFLGPAGIAASADGRIYVADRLNQRVLALHDDFTLDHEIELAPEYSRGVAVNPDGDELYVVDTSETLTAYDTDTWTVNDSFGDTGPIDEQMSNPYHVTTDEIGFVYVGNTGSSTVQKFTPSGRFVWTLDPGTISGVFLGLPTPGGLLGVTDSGHDKVQIYDLCPGGFTDVAETHPFWFEICWMDTANVSTGYADGSYRPADDVTRQAMAAFIVRAVGPETWVVPGTPTFPDVPPSHPFYDEIEWMASEGIAGGYADGKYHPADAVTRQAMAAFMYRAAGEPAFTPPISPSFDDVPTSHPFYDEIEWMAAEAIAHGFPDDTYRPTEPVTRQAMSAFLARLALIT